MTPSSTSQTSRLTRPQAAAVIRHYAVEHIDEHGFADCLDAEFGELRLRLSWYVGGLIHPADLEQFLESLVELDSVDAGTHPDIERNRARTIDNTAEVRDEVEQELTVVLNQMLDGARVTGAYVRFDGTTLTAPRLVPFEVAA